MLKPQDLLVSLKLAASPRREPPSYGWLAHELGMSPSEVHAAVRRATHAGLLRPEREPNFGALIEFIVHGVKYAFPPQRGSITRGMPTAHAAPPLDREIASDDVPPVWPDPEGAVRGEGFEPLYRSVPKAAAADASLYELLALVDALRGGRARERKLAEKHLVKRLGT